MIETAGIIFYLVLQLGIGYWASRYIKNESDYFIAGRRIGIWFASFSIFATWFGAETCMGAAAAIFDKGLSGARAEPFGYAISLLIAATFLSASLWKRKYITLADLYRSRFSPTVEKIAILILAPTSLLWAAAQIRAFGQIISITTDFDVNMAITFAAIFVIIYTTLGGLLADVVTDFFQGIIIILGLAILLFFVFSSLGGVGPALSKIEPAHLSFVDPEEGFWQRIDAWMVPVLGGLIAQEFVSRILSAKSAKVASRASFAAAGMYLIIGSIPVMIGLLGAYLPIKLEHNDQFLPELAKQLLPQGLFIIFLGALISAILSTVNSTILGISALVSHNFITKEMPKLSEKKKVFVARGIVILSGVSAYFIAISADSIYELITSSSSFGTAGLVIITFAALWSKKFGGREAAVATLITGIATTIIFQWFYEIDAPFITSLLLSFLVYFSFATKKLFIKNRR